MKKSTPPTRKLQLKTETVQRLPSLPDAALDRALGGAGAPPELTRREFSWCVCAQAE